MMVEYKIMNFTFIWKLSVLFIFVFCADSFNFKCPSQSSWKFRAQEICNRTLEYFCLYNNVLGKYIEGCKGPDWDRKGNKRIFVGYFSREKCILQRFQPFLFWTNGSTSDCIYSKSICSEEGQILYRDNSTKDDRACRCDHKKNYSFVKIPRNVCYCIPTEEDCSCYIKSCSSNLTLSTDYSCTQNIFQETALCKDITEYNKTVKIKTAAFMSGRTSKDGSFVHGSNTVISMLHHSLTNYGYFKRKGNQHADDYEGIVCSIDAGFAHSKRFYRRSNVELLQDMAEIVDKSTSSNSVIIMKKDQKRTEVGMN